MSDGKVVALSVVLLFALSALVMVVFDLVNRFWDGVPATGYWGTMAVVAIVNLTVAGVRAFFKAFR